MILDDRVEDDDVMEITIARESKNMVVEMLSRLERSLLVAALEWVGDASGDPEDDG